MPRFETSEAYKLSEMKELAEKAKINERRLNELEFEMGYAPYLTRMILLVNMPQVLLIAIPSILFSPAFLAFLILSLLIFTFMYFDKPVSAPYSRRAYQDWFYGKKGKVSAKSEYERLKQSQKLDKSISETYEQLKNDAEFRKNYFSS